MTSVSTYGWRIPTLSEPADGPKLAQELGDDIARDMTRVAPDPNVLGANNGSGAGLVVSGNFVTGAMGEMLVVPGVLTVPTGWTALVRVDLSTEWVLSSGFQATAQVQTRRNGAGWQPTRWTGAWGCYVNNDSGATDRIQAKAWWEYLLLNDGDHEFRMVGGSNTGSAPRAVLFRIDVALLTMSPPGVSTDVPAGGDGAIPT